MPNYSKGNVIKSEFYYALNKVLRGKHSTNYLTRQSYKKIIKQVNSAKKTLLPRNNNLLKKYDVLKRGRKEEKLVFPGTGDIVIYYAMKSELYDILEEAHLKTGHGGQANMANYVQEKYKNITYESIRTYIKLCETCQNKKIINQKKTITMKPNINKNRTVGLIDFISMEETPDGEYNFILVYRDKVTKFVQLKPLRNMKFKELSSVLTDIFTSFGAPTKIQSTDETLVVEALKGLTSSWNGPPIIHEKVTVTYPTDDIKNLLGTWLFRCNTTKWSDSLRFIQYMKNLMLDHELKKSPFEAMFGRRGKLDVSSLNLPQEMIDEIRPEEEQSNDFEISDMLEVVMVEE